MATNTTPAINFVDLATFTDLEAYLYGGMEAVTYFVRAVKKSNWFAYVPIVLRHTSGNPAFNTEFSASVNRSGDYVLNIFLRVRFPILRTAVGTIRWTDNLMHNLCTNIEITFNELKMQEFDNVWLDFNYQFRTPMAKDNGYLNMIGMIANMTQPKGVGIDLGNGQWFNLPLPFWFTEDSGVALPVAALPYNDIKVNYTFQQLSRLIILTGVATMANVTASNDGGAVFAAATDASLLAANVQTWAHYVTLHNDERVKMGKAPRDILIHQVQRMPSTAVTPNPVLNTAFNYDLRFSHGLQGIFYAYRNTTVLNEPAGIANPSGGEWSNYTAASFGSAGTVPADPILSASLIYENTSRFNQMGSDYTATVAPWYFADRIPVAPGYHMFPYSLNVFDLDPKGSTNYSKLSNVQLSLLPSQAAVTGVAAANPETWTLEVRARNHNIARISGGSMGLPVL